MNYSDINIIKLLAIMVSGDKELIPGFVEGVMGLLPKTSGCVVLGDFALRETNRDRSETAYRLNIKNYKPEPRYETSPIIYAGGEIIL